MKKEEKFDFENFEKEAIKKLRSGKGLIGEQGALTGLIGRILKAAYEEEITDHITPNSQSKTTTHIIQLIQKNNNTTNAPISFACLARG